VKLEMYLRYRSTARSEIQSETSHDDKEEREHTIVDGWPAGWMDGWRVKAEDRTQNPCLGNRLTHDQLS
jgi:hypothetical protein